MSVTVDNSNDATPDAGSAWYITVSSLPDGRVTSVELSDVAPYNDTTFMDDPRATVWQSPLPEYEGDRAHAVKVLDLALSDDYRDENGALWAKGEQLAYEFHNDYTADRALFRTVQARLTLAGYPHSYVGMVSCQDYGLTLSDANEYWVFRDKRGWRFATKDYVDIYGWDLHPEPIAPAGASPRRVAVAILVHLASLGELDTGTLSPLHRIRVQCSLRRIKPNWEYFTYRVREAHRRYRNRITVRVR